MKVVLYLVLQACAAFVSIQYVALGNEWQLFSRSGFGFLTLETSVTGSSQSPATVTPVGPLQTVCCVSLDKKVPGVGLDF